MTIAQVRAGRHRDAIGNGRYERRNFYFWKPQMNAHADLEQEEHIRVVKAVTRMRRVDFYITLLFVLLAMLGLGASLVWGKEDGYLFIGMLFGLSLTFTVAYIKFVKLACPACGMQLMPSGKFSIGTLNMPRCAGCDVSFEMDRR
jgi:hypothetical protein